MFNLITLTGPSGSGKSAILKMMTSIDEDYFVVPKYTTRARRKDDDDSIINVDKLPDDCDYRYFQYGDEYGFQSQAIYDCIKRGKKPIAIVNNEQTLRKLHKSFGENVKSYFIHRGKPSLMKLISICNSRGVTDPKVIQSRFEVANNIYKIYTDNIRLFDSIILNIGDLSETRKIVEQILKDERTSSERHSVSQGNKIFVVAGNASSGKDLIARAANKVGCKIVPKHASRLRNPNDGEEIICIGDEDYNLDACDLKYTNNEGTVYGIEQDRILRNYVFSNENQLLVCSDIGTINKLKSLFGKAVVPLYVHSDITPEEYMQLESKEGSDNDYIQKRLVGFKDAHIDYTNNVCLYDRCLIYAEDQRELLLQFAGILGVKPNKDVINKNREVK